MFYQRIVVTPALGKANELRSLLEERVRADQSRIRTLLVERILGKGQGFVVGIFHENLEAFEKEREYLKQDSTFRDFTGKVTTLVESQGTYNFTTSFRHQLPQTLRQVILT